MHTRHKHIYRTASGVQTHIIALRFVVAERPPEKRAPERYFVCWFLPRLSFVLFGVAKSFAMCVVCVSATRCIVFCCCSC